MTTALTTRAFWTQAAERAFKTLAQTIIATIGTTAAVSSVDWVVVIDVALLAAALSVLTSIVSVPVGPDESPSLV